MKLAGMAGFLIVVSGIKIYPVGGSFCAWCELRESNSHVEFGKLT